MPDLELLDIQKIMCEVVEDQHADRKFDSWTMESASALSCKVNTDTDSRLDSMDVINSNPNILDYFRSSANKEADKKAS